MERLSGSQGPAWGTRLTQREDVAVAVRAFLSAAMLEQALSRQARQEHRPAEYQACPGCGPATQPQDPEPRMVQTRAGEAEWQEPHAYCRKCRQAFFPSERVKKSVHVTPPSG